MSYYSKFIMCLLVFVLSPIQLTMAKSIDIYERAYHENRVSSLLYRWYALNERPGVYMDFQRELFTEDFVIDAPSGRFHGGNYPDYFQTLPLNGEVSYHLENLDILSVQGNQITAEATARVQVSQGKHYKQYIVLQKILLLESSEILPQIKYLEIIPIATRTAPQVLPSAYYYNRFMALLTYYGAIFDRGTQDPTPFKEFFSTNLQWQSPSTTQLNYQGIAQYLSTRKSRTKKSLHRPVDVTFTQIGENLFQVNFKFSWRGLLKNNKEMKTRSTHTWVIRDNWKRYLMVESINIIFPEPVVPVSGASGSGQ